jgi:4-hydroxybenzoate polyprenyltransferase
MGYQKARIKSLTQSNIKAGFKASGIWPVSMAKPLLSRFVIIGQDTPPAPCPSTPKAVRDILSTPRHGRDVVHQFQQLLKVGTTDPARRCLFRRVGHHFDRQNTKIAEAHAKIANLEASIEQLRPRKRQKIVPTANDRFVTIDVVMKARERYASKNSPQSVQQTIRQHEFEDLCFEWQIE